MIKLDKEAINIGGSIKLIDFQIDLHGGHFLACNPVEASDLCAALARSRQCGVYYTRWPVSGQLGDFCPLFTSLFAELPSNCEQLIKKEKVE